MKIFISGATGFIGSELVNRLINEGHEVVCYVRDVGKARQKIKGKVEFLGTSAFPGHVTKVLEGCDAVVNEPATVEKDPSAPETFPVETLPDTVKAPVVLLNVKLVLPANEPPSLN